jgi:hypothetical protein
MSDSILSAVIGASIALIGLIVSKEGKTSEFRQQWIDGLRADIASLISCSLHPSEGAAKTANECQARINLRLNPDESPSIELLGAVERLGVSVNGKATPDETESAATKVVETAQVVLKSEWKRVKRGEWKYVTVLSIASASLIISVAILLYAPINVLFLTLFR